MPTITLDSIKTAVELKYEPVTIELGEAGSVQLIQALRLPKERRAELGTMQAEFNRLQREAEAASEEDREADAASAEDRSIEHMRRIVHIVARSHEEADLLLDCIGEDVATLMEVFKTYSEASELGEA